jgi:hypothetical protein
MFEVFMLMDEAKNVVLHQASEPHYQAGQYELASFKSRAKAPLRQ